MTVRKTLYTKSWTSLFRWGYILKVRSPNLYIVIIVTKIKKGFLKKKEKVKGFFIFLTMLLFKQVESNYTVRRSPTNKVAVTLLNFLIVWTLDTVNIILFFQFELKITMHAARTKKKTSVKWTTFDNFLRRVNFIFMFFQAEISPWCEPWSRYWL